MKLLMHERLNLLSILPEAGDFTTLKIVRELRESLAPSEEEHEALNIRQEEKRIVWDMPKDPETLYRDIQIGKKAEGIVVAALEKLNEDKKLTDQFFSLYEKFCVGEE